MIKYTQLLLLLFTTVFLSCFNPAIIRAQDVSSFSIGKGQVYQQSSSTNPVLKAVNAYVFEASVYGNDSAIFSASLNTPAGTVYTLEYDFSGNGLEIQEAFATPELLNQTFTSGSYQFTIETANDGTRTGPLSMGDVIFPSPPHISNYPATQVLNPVMPFTLAWNPIPGATAQDFIRVRVVGNFGDINFDSGAPLQPGSLNGAATSVTMNPSSFSDDTVTATVQFSKVLDRQTSGIPGATGYVLANAVTELQLKITDSSSGDVIPPVLVSSTPPHQAVNVPVNSPITFTFSEAMQPAQSIAWSSNLSSNKFQYAWSANGRTLIATYSDNFPSNSIITWQLNPPALPLFSDIAGNPLLPGLFNGQFTTSSTQGTNSSPCDPGSDEEGGGFSVTKSINYVQTTAGSPVLDSETAAIFSAFVGSPTNNVVTQASLTLPNGAIKAMTNFFGGSFFLMDDNIFANLEALELAYPPGNYSIAVNRQNGSVHNIAFSFPTDPFPPVPQILNFPQAQAIDANSDFALQWNPFTGAQGSDSIYLYIYDESDSGSGWVFEAPDPCVPRELPVSATSIIIPKGIFAPGKLYQGTLSFYRSLMIDTNSIPDIPGQVSTGQSTRFTLKTSGDSPVPTPPRFESVVRQGQNLQLRLTGQPSVDYIIESTPNLSQSWTPLLTTNSPSGTIQFSWPINASQSSQFFRSRNVP